MSSRKTHSHSHSSHKTVRRRSALSKRGGMLGAILVIVLIAAVIYAFSQNKSAQTLPVEISAQQAYEYYQSGDYFFLDVREQEEWDTFHIPGATLIPLGQLADRLAEVPTDKPIIVVCRSGNRSQQGRDILLNAGYTNVTSMAGGSTAWSNLGYPIDGTRP